MKNTQAPQKTKGKSSSLVGKLTRSQLARSLFQLICLDAFIVLLFACSLVVYTEWAAGELAPQIFNSSGGRQTIANAEYSMDTTPPRGLRLPAFMEWRLPALTGTTRHVEINSGNVIFIKPEALRYTVEFPDQHSDAVLRLHYSWNKQIQVFYICFVFLLVWQAIGWLRSVFRISRSVRHALRPIYDLTLTTQSINAEPARTRVEDLYLSGTIETLKTITENKLDTRIVIQDEREELRGLATAINDMLDRLDAAYQSQLRFVSDASHELRTPIAVIQGYANLLDRWGKDDEKTLEEAIAAIKSETGSMQDLVEQLLFLARSDNDSIVLNTHPLDLAALAQEVFAETKMIDPHHSYDCELSEALPVFGDVQLLKQALRIFVDNAMKYTPPGEHITILGKQENGFAKISVSDTGIGIPEADLPFVFDRFFRSDQSRTRKTGGTGLGLSIAKWIVDRHGGHVELLSRKDIGTRICLVLPLQK